MQVTFNKMDGVYSGCTDIAKLNRVQSCPNFLHITGRYILPNTPEGEVRGEGTFLFFISQARGSHFDALLQGRQVWWGVQSGP